MKWTEKFEAISKPIKKNLGSKLLTIQILWSSKLFWVCGMLEPSLNGTIQILTDCGTHLHQIQFLGLQWARGVSYNSWCFSPLMIGPRGRRDSGRTEELLCVTCLRLSMTIVPGKNCFEEYKEYLWSSWWKPEESWGIMERKLKNIEEWWWWRIAKKHGE